MICQMILSKYVEPAWLVSRPPGGCGVLSLSPLRPHLSSSSSSLPPFSSSSSSSSSPPRLSLSYPLKDFTAQKWCVVPLPEGRSRWAGRVPVAVVAACLLSPSRWCSCGHHLACTLACLALVHSRGDDLGLLSVARSLLTPMTLSLPPLPSALAGLPPPTRFSRPSPSTSSTLPSSTSASRTSSSGSYRAPTPSSWCVASLLPSCERCRRTGEGIGGAEWLADRPTGWWSEYER
jgi:hypothetical protein